MKKLVLLFIGLFLTTSFVFGQVPPDFKNGVRIGDKNGLPTGVKQGHIIWDNNTSSLYVYDGTEWVNLIPSVVPDIEAIPTTQTITLGEIGATLIEDAFNAATLPLIQEQNEGYVLIKTTVSGEETDYLFVGVGGSYGTGGTLTAIEDDFVTVDVTAVSNLDVWRNRFGTLPATSYDEWISHGGNASISQNLFVGGAISTEIAQSRLNIGGNYGVNFTGGNPNHAQFRFNNISPASQGGAKGNVVIGRGFVFPVGSANALATSLQFNPTVDFINVADKANSYHRSIYVNPSYANMGTAKTYSIFSERGDALFKNGTFTIEDIAAPAGLTYDVKVDDTGLLSSVVSSNVDESKWEIVDTTINNVGVGDLRVPTETELNDERLSWGTNNSAGAFGSPLKLTVGGNRNENGTIFGIGTNGSYWTSSINDTKSRMIGFLSGGAFVSSADRAEGLSIRLILNGTFTQQNFNDNYLNQTIVIEGLTYGYVYNPTTSRIWLDRNLGATQVAISSTDADAYGWLYQWGRGTDGHQIRTSGTTATLSSTDVPLTGDFITTSVVPNDWRSPQNDNLWQVGQKLIGKNTLKADYEDLLNKPTISTITTTSQLTNDGADGVNPFITASDVVGDNLGNHTATQTLNMSGNIIDNVASLYNNNDSLGIFSDVQVAINSRINDTTAPFGDLGYIGFYDQGVEIGRFIGNRSISNSRLEVGRSITNQGSIRLNANSTSGGLIIFKNDPNNETTISNWNINAYLGDLTLWGTGGTNSYALPNLTIDDTTGAVKADETDLADYAILGNKTLVTEEKLVDYITNNTSTVTNTSQLTNDGANGVNPYITANDLPSQEIPFVTIDTPEYTFIEADIAAFKPHFIKDTTTTANVTLTIPQTALTGLNYINVMHEGAGNTTIIPATGVNQVKYESSSAKNITLVSREDDVWRLAEGDAIASAYVAPIGAIPTYVGATQQDAAATDVIAVTGMTPTTGNLLVATVTYFTSAETISAPVGWTTLGSDFVNFPVNAIFYKISDGTETNVSFLCSNIPAQSPHLATIYEFSGVNQTTPIESFALNAGVDALSAPLPSLTTTGQNRLAVGLIMNVMGNDSDGAVTIGGSWIERFNLGTGLSSDSRQLMYTQETPTASTIASETITFPFADWTVTAVLALNPE